MTLRIRTCPALLALILTSCTEPAQQGQVNDVSACNAPAVLDVVQRLGAQMRRVSLLAPDSMVQAQIRQHYAQLVTPDLLDAWLANPRAAPGRQVSSPWPARIEIDSVHTNGDAQCTVRAAIVHVTSTDTAGDDLPREPVTLMLRENGQWRISAYQPSSAVPGAPVVPDSAVAESDAVDVLRRYYAAINERDFRQAYELWGDGGAASGSTFERFAAGFAETARVQVDIGTPGRIEGAAGSRYIKVPVTIQAVQQDSSRQRFEGTYTLRRSVVDGATRDQRGWHIYSADVTKTP